MRHLKRGRKFNKKRGARKAFFKILLANLILKGKIHTTEARAKEIRPMIERLVSIGKAQNLAAFRLLLSRLSTKSVAEKLYYEIVPRYKDRQGGYTRILKTSRTRKRDSAPTAIIEFI